MCGRYAQPIAPETLPEWFARQGVPLESVENADKRTEHRYNIAPTEYAPVYIKKSGDGEDDGSGSDEVRGKIEYMRWGIVPPWITKASDVNKSGYSTFNARFENLTSNRLWKANLSRRCVIPILGYYEWQQVADKKGTNKDKRKTPYFIKRRDGELMFLAGLYHHGTVADNNSSIFTKSSKKDNPKEALGSYTIITREAPKMLKWLHGRMPVVLRPEDDEFTQWLDGKGTSDADYDLLLKKYEHEEDLEWYPVDPAVGNSRTDNERYVKPWKQESVLNFFKSKQAVKREHPDGTQDAGDAEHTKASADDRQEDGQGQRKRPKIKQEEST